MKVTSALRCPAFRISTPPALAHPTHLRRPALLPTRSAEQVGQGDGEVVVARCKRGWGWSRTATGDSLKGSQPRNASAAESQSQPDTRARDNIPRSRRAV